MKQAAIALVCVLGLGACDASSEKPAASSSDVANRLEKAADQSGPVAKEVLRDAADEARKQPTMEPVDQPGSFAQRAMQKAGEAEASASSAAPPSPSEK
jgi:hypothetical protein